MILLCLDPSSTAVGYAASTGPRPKHLLDAGIITPDNPKAKSFDRMASLYESTYSLLQETLPDEVLIESPGIVTFNKSNAGIVFYGAAFGVIYGACMAYQHTDDMITPHISLVESRIWTRGKKKEKRADVIAELYPSYKAQRDAVAALRAAGKRVKAFDDGLDLADALGLTQWHYATKGNPC